MNHCGFLPRVLAHAVVCLTVTGTLFSQEWTRFRGPNGSGISHAKTIPSVWTDRDVRWRAALPGLGHSSPVIWDRRVFVTAVSEDGARFQVLCLDAASGGVLWNRPFPYHEFNKHKFNSFASATPVVDERMVYVAWSVPERLQLAAVDHAGQVVWQRDLGPYVSQHGCGASPILHEGRVIFANEQDGESFVTALDAATGKTLWMLPRRTKTTAYSTPVIHSPEAGKAQLILNSQAHGIYAIEPHSGKVAWEVSDAFDKRSVSSPVVAGDLILGSCGSGGGGNFVSCVRVGKPGAGGGASVVYQVKKSAPYVPTAVALGDWAWLWSDSGVVSLIDVATGAVRWQERVGGNYFGSPVWVSGRLFAVSTSGEVVCVDGGDTFKVLGRYDLKETTHSTPAVSGGRMYVHTERSLVCVGAELPAR